jgi:hypothetical protein
MWKNVVAHIPARYRAEEYSAPTAALRGMKDESARARGPTLSSRCASSGALSKHTLKAISDQRINALNVHLLS